MTGKLTHSAAAVCDGNHMHLEDLKDALAGSGLAELMLPEDIATLSRAASVQSCPAGTVLWRAGEVSRGLCIVLEGEVRVVRSRNGRDHLVHSSGPGATMGEVPLFGEVPYPATALVSRDALCLMLPADKVRAVASSNSAFSAHLLREVCRRVDGLVARLEAQTLGGVRSRLANWLLDASEEAATAIVSIPRPQATWAEDLGTVREVLARELAAVEEAGVIARRGPGQVELLDVSELRAIAIGG